VNESGKGKGKAVPLHAMEALGGRGGIAQERSEKERKGKIRIRKD
jgi:hypothetical protein